MSLKITICDVTVRERVVELPDNCPKCGVALREPGTLVGWEYQDQKRPMSVRDDGTIDYAEDGWSPEGGETFISYVTLVCECGEFLVEGDMKFEQTPEARPETVETTTKRRMGRLVSSLATYVSPDDAGLDRKTFLSLVADRIRDDILHVPEPKPARLDADRTAKPKTRLVGHAKVGERVGPGLVQPDAIEDTTTGERTSLDAEVSLPLYTVRETGSRTVVAGLDSVPAGNANIMRLVPTVPLEDLALHEKTLARRNGEVYEIIRVK